MTRQAIATWAALLVAGCQSSGIIYVGEDYDPEVVGPDGDPSVMQGVLGGEPWRMDKATTAEISTHSHVTSITFWTEGHDGGTCGDPRYCEVPCVTLVTDMDEGSWDLDDYEWHVSYSVPVGDGGYGGPFPEGEVRMTEANIQFYSGEPSTLSGWISVWKDEDHHVQGTFRDVIICYYDDPYWP